MSDRGCYLSVALADRKDRTPIRCLAIPQKVVALFRTKMGEIHKGGRIVGKNVQHVAHGKGTQTFAGLQDRQRAFQPACVKCLGSFHGQGVQTTETIVEQIVSLRVMTCACGAYMWKGKE